MVLSQPPLFIAPVKDYLQLLNNGIPDGQRIVELLKFKKADVSVATNIPITSVRYEPNKMPSELRENLTEWAAVLNLVAGFFCDNEKTALWFCTPNPLLGDMTPRDMIRVGRFKKFLNFIQSTLGENQR